MAQIQSGSVAVVNGNNKVIASAGNDWSQAIVNGFFSVVGTGEVLYTIASITDPAHSTSGYWEITLSGNYAGVTNATAAYMIHHDFTVRKNFPILNPGDVNTAQIVARLTQMLDALLP
jgi:hypothetical protein